MAATRAGSQSSSDVRVGPLAFFTLLAVLSLAVLAVLSLSTANATLALAQRRADATTQLYLDETAAQRFVATLDEQLAQAGDAATATDAAAAAAREAAGGAVVVEARQANGIFTASFDAGNGRQLDIEIHLQADGTLSVQKWRMTTVVNEEPAMGTLFGSN